MTASSKGSDAETCLSFAVRLLAVAERGHTEPESKSVQRELSEAIETSVWYDEGPFHAASPFSCNGTQEATESVLAKGSLADVTETLSGESASRDATCLRDNDSVCYGIDWELDASVGNGVQTDQVVLALDVITESTTEPAS
jgi:hypothetical protein